MKKLIGLILFVGLLLFLFTSCPEKEAHTETIAEILPEILPEVMPKELPDAFNQKLIAVFAESILNGDPETNKAIAKSLVDVDDYWLFSIGRETFTGDSHVVSFGIGGHVFTINDDIVKKFTDRVESLQ